MKASLILAVVLLLTPGLAWAEEAQPAATADPFEGGGCVLPDLTGLSEDDATAALGSAGFAFAPIDTAVPACPVTSSCNSIGNCGIGLCSVSDIGQCCATSGGPIICCISGSIKVRQCSCVCTGSPCAVVCPQKTDVKWRCA